MLLNLSASVAWRSGRRQTLSAAPPDPGVLRPFRTRGLWPERCPARLPGDRGESSKIQDPEKLQHQIHNADPGTAGMLGPGAWCFTGSWSLELGAFPTPLFGRRRLPAFLASLRLPGSMPGEAGSSCDAAGSSLRKMGWPPKQMGACFREKSVTPQKKGATPREKGATPWEKRASLRQAGSSPNHPGSSEKPPGSPPEERGTMKFLPATVENGGSAAENLRATAETKPGLFRRVIPRWGRDYLKAA